MHTISFSKSLRLSLVLLLLLSFCQLESYALDPGADIPNSTDLSEQTVAPTSFDQVILKQLNSTVSGFLLKDAILGMMFLPKEEFVWPPKYFPIAVVRNTSISLSDLQSGRIREYSEVITLNNKGVKYLNGGDYPSAIKCFHDALELDSQYKLARDNLAITYNNYALALRQTPTKALPQFHLALYVNPSNRTTQQNVEGMIRMLHLNPQSFEDRVQLGDQARTEGDLLGALVEYKAAYELKSAPTIISRIVDAFSRLTIFERLLNPNFIDRSKFSLSADNVKTTASELSADVVVPRLDFGPYMSDLQLAIEKKWSPVGELKSSEVIVLFSVNSRGELVEVEVDRGSGIRSADQAAIEAVKNASPFSVPPSLPPPSLNSTTSFKMTFNYKYLNGPVDFQEFPVNFDTYTRVISHTIYQRWVEPAHQKVPKAVLLFSIDKMGKLLNLRVKRSSGSHELDLSAEQAVQSSAPFPVLPPGSDPKVDIEFTFDFNRPSSAMSTANPAPAAPAAAAPAAASFPRQTLSATPYPFAQVADYTALVGERLEKSWHPKSIPVTVIFRVSDQGAVFGLQVYSSSGDKMLDEKALSVVRSCVPFPKPPAGALPLDVQYTFK